MKTMIEYRDGREIEIEDQRTPGPRAEARRRIAEIEATVTPRRLREAVLTPAGASWLAEQEAAIAAIRATL